MRTFLVLVLSVAPTVMIACEDPFTKGAPADSPGVLVPGLNAHCFDSYGCAAWSADSKTMYIVATVGSSNVASLVAVDAASLAVRVIGAIDDATFALEPSADGTATYFGVLDQVTPGAWIIKRMSLSDGRTMAVAETRTLEFLVSPDGTTLAYHAPSSVLARDTVVVLDVTSGARRASIVASVIELEAFSADGTQLLTRLSSGQAPSIQIWHFTSGVRDTVPIAGGALYRAGWSGGDFRMLFAGADGKAFIDTSLGGGSSIAYAVGQNLGRIVWLPDRSAMWTVPANTICGPQDCNSIIRYDFVYTTARTTVTVGAARATHPMVVAASPDGRWLAHAEDFGRLYLVERAP